MKKILITGAGSFVGKSLCAYLDGNPGYSVSTLSVRDDAWKHHSFTGVDVIYHCAAIVHEPATKNDSRAAERYHRVNAVLPYELAVKARAEGVGQFIFLSSAAVYGVESTVGKPCVIEKNTPTVPTDLYGQSKLEAEKMLQTLSDDSFKVTIIRPPMIYGASCKGNFNALVSLARKLPVFPKTYNSHFMLYIDNLSEFVRLMIDTEASGIFCPQNDCIVSTDEIVRLIAKQHGKKMIIIPGFLWALKILGCLSPKARKAFGSQFYNPQLSHSEMEYCVVSLEESIARSCSG